MSKSPVRVEVRRRRGTIKSLHQALDQAYRQLREAARADWNRLFTDPNQNERVATLRISKDQTPEELAGNLRPGFFPIRASLINHRLDNVRRPSRDVR
jgi:hypothetical protein